MTAMDYALLPPEINSGLMYAGAGAGPLLAAAAAWDGISGELGSAAIAYQTVLSQLTDEHWHGPSSTAMAAAATRYVQWMRTTATQAARAASQAKATAAAYDEAFAATVPPPVIDANRTLLAALVATNVLGQNAAAIAANQADYAEMWAQDAAAMYGYASNSAAATQMTPFSPAPRDSRPVAQAGQVAAISQGDGSQGLSGLTNGPIAQAIVNFLNSPFVQNLYNIQNATLPYSTFIQDGLGTQASQMLFVLAPMENAGMQLGIGWAAAIHSAQAEAGLVPPMPGALLSSEVSPGGLGATRATSPGSGPAGAEVSAGMGRSATVSALSVPTQWSTSAPAVRLAAAATPGAAMTPLPQPGMTGAGMPALSSLGGLPVVGSVVNAPKNGGSNSLRKTTGKVISELTRESSTHDDVASLGTSASNSVLSERDELNKLRKNNSDLRRERELLWRTAHLLANDKI